MARTNRDRLDLPPLELRCMKALWALENATVHQIRARILPDHPLAYTTVMTVMGRLVRKGVAQREKHGRAHFYRPAVSEITVREHELNQVIENFFRGSRDELRRHLGSAGQAQGRQLAVEAAAAPSATNTSGGSGSVSAKELDIDESLL